ncbi:MAG: 3D domain-containing protein [Spirochaetes bacterium]|nr:3D domain-containing protein [Spirochaetota bacterium]
MKKEHQRILLACIVLVAVAIIAAIVYGCSGCSGCSGPFGCSKEGSKIVAPSFSGESLQVTVYAYCPCAKCNTEKWKGRVATGHMMKELLAEGKNICAADWSVIPLGSIVNYDGKDYVVADVGRKIKGNTINILLDTHKESEDFGIKRDQTITFTRPSE